MNPDNLLGVKQQVPLFNVKQIFYERTQDPKSIFIEVVDEEEIQKEELDEQAL